VRGEGCIQLGARRSCKELCNSRVSVHAA